MPPLSLNLLSSNDPTQSRAVSRGGARRLKVPRGDFQLSYKALTGGLALIILHLSRLVTMLAHPDIARRERLRRTRGDQRLGRQEIIGGFTRIESSSAMPGRSTMRTRLSEALGVRRSGSSEILYVLSG